MNTSHISLHRPALNGLRTKHKSPSLSLLLLAWLFVVTSQINAQTITLSSGDRQVQLVELYTSEGCSSCPPADNWLRQYKNSEQLWQSIVPIAWHVDYWDYIGWKDLFASAANSNRQRKLRRTGQSKSVYTPQFIVQGKEWRGFFSRAALASQPNTRSKNRLNFQLTNNKQQSSFTANFIAGKTASEPNISSNPARKAGYQLHIALLGMNIKQPIKAGENRGKTLKHDFVVLAHKRFNSKQQKAKNLTKPGSSHWQGALPTTSKQAKAIAVWVTPINSEVPIQATGGYL